MWINERYLGERHEGFNPTYDIYPPEDVPELQGYVMHLSAEQVMISKGAVMIRPGKWDRDQHEMVYEFRKNMDGGNESASVCYTEQQIRSLYEK